MRYILQKKQEEQGFTLIELLVVIIIIGILSAIALPSFLNQANKAKQTEGKTYIGSMNRAQQTYYLENNSFASSLSELGLGIATQTENYRYNITGGGSGVTNVTNQAQPLQDQAPLKAYIGVVALIQASATNEATTLAVLCEAEKSEANGGDDGTTTVTPSTRNLTNLTCPARYIGNTAR